MKEREQHHLDTFENLLNDHGTAIGDVTAVEWCWFHARCRDRRDGPKAAMACTIAVEEVIGEHYHQVNQLDADHDDLRQILSQFGDEELEHRDTAIDHDGEDAVGYPVMRRVIQAGCRTAIKLAERF